MKPIVMMRFGSHLYGTATPQSDTDIKGVYIPEAKEILLGRSKPVISRKTKADKNAKNSADDTDEEIYSLQKYLALAAEGQTVAMDMLFAPDDMITQFGGPWEFGDIWRTIRNNTDQLLSRKAASFIGYCRQQANKYGIKGSRMAAAKIAVEYFQMCLNGNSSQTKVIEFSTSMEAFFDTTEHVEFIDIEVRPGESIRHISVCNRKVPYHASIKTAYEIYKRLYDEYGQRAKAAMNNEGIDWKALSHAVRVGREAIELLNTGHITFPRPEAAHLLAIKTGQLAYQPVSEEIEQLLVDVEEASAKSKLPEEPNWAWIDNFVIECHAEVVNDEYGP